MCKYYEERCNALRHYSSIITDLRKVTIIQGFVIVTATIFLMKENLISYSIVLSLFGLLFTLILIRQQKNDLDIFSIFENQIKIPDNPESSDDPWVNYTILRKERLDKWWNKLSIIYGPSLLILLAFLTLLAFNICNYYTSDSKEKEKQIVELIVTSEQDVQVKIK